LDSPKSPRGTDSGFLTPQNGSTVPRGVFGRSAKAPGHVLRRRERSQTAPPHSRRNREGSRLPSRRPDGHFGSPPSLCRSHVPVSHAPAQRRATADAVRVRSEAALASSAGESEWSWFRGATRGRFLGRFHGSPTAQGGHEPRRAAFPGCRLTGLSSPVFVRGAGKPPEPAGRNACPTGLRFMKAPCSFRTCLRVMNLGAATFLSPRLPRHEAAGMSPLQRPVHGKASKWLASRLTPPASSWPRRPVSDRGFLLTASPTVLKETLKLPFCPGLEEAGERGASGGSFFPRQARLC